MSSLAFISIATGMSALILTAVALLVRGVSRETYLEQKPAGGDRLEREPRLIPRLRNLRRDRATPTARRRSESRRARPDGLSAA